MEIALHGDFAGTQWIMNAYTIACSTVLMATGILADRYGRKRVFLYLRHRSRLRALDRQRDPDDMGLALGLLGACLHRLLLVQGVAQHLRTVLAGSIDAASWRALVNGIASGNVHPDDAVAAAAVPAETLAAISRAALSHGFGWVMLYGGIAAWAFAAASLLVFSVRKAGQ